MGICKIVKVYIARYTMTRKRMKTNTKKKTTEVYKI